VRHGRLEPLPGIVARQRHPARQLGLRHRRDRAELTNRDPAVVDDQVERQLAPLEGELLGERVGGADRELLDHGPALDLRRGLGERHVEPDFGQPVGQPVKPKTGRGHARKAQRQAMGRDRQRPAAVGSRRRGRHRPATVAGQGRGRRRGDRGAVEPGRGVRVARHHHLARGLGIPQRRGGSGRRLPLLRPAHVPHPTGRRPARERAVGPERARGDQVGDPPRIGTARIDKFDRAIHEFQFTGHARGLSRRRQPGGEDVFQRTAAGPDGDDGLHAREPHRPQVPRIEDEPEQTLLDDERRHDHGRPAGRVGHDDVAILDAAEPAPVGRAAGDRAVDPGEGPFQRSVAQARVDDHRRRQPGERGEHGERRQREHAHPPPRPYRLFSGSSPGHGGEV
jgi:hypothetical protein